MGVVIRWIKEQFPHLRVERHYTVLKPDDNCRPSVVMLGTQVGFLTRTVGFRRTTSSYVAMLFKLRWCE